MARKDNNFLLGRGEALTHNVLVRSGGGDKNPPYTFSDSRERLTPKLENAAGAFRTLPPAARPNDTVVAMVTMHPRYISKSDFPSAFFDSFGLRPVGSRSRKIKPESWGVKNPPEDAIANDIFVSGPLSTFGSMARTLKTFADSVRWADDLTHIEDIAAFTAEAKLHIEGKSSPGSLYEIVLHNAYDRSIVPSFVKYARSAGATPLEQWRRDAGGLTFIPVRASEEILRLVADFSYVRAARVMPRLRILRPDIVRLAATARFQLPEDPPLDPDSSVVIFDGGLPPDVDLSRWVTLIEPKGIGSPSAALQEHGLAVTSAVLFGNLEQGRAAGRPLCHIDHVRVLDVETEQSDFQYLIVLDRIVSHLERQGKIYQFSNTSLGPRHSIDDGEVTQWTARIDQALSSGSHLMTVAAGNDGEFGPEFGLNRIQPPADGVNVLSVGSSDSSGPSWRRASYSCVGPGRAPGIVKPDGLAFGGTPQNPYFVLASQPMLSTVGVSGTSIAAPHALRSGIAVRTQLGAELNPLAIRALLIHSAEESVDVGRCEAGWGRFREDYQDLITCNDDETLVVYQGELPMDYHLRAPIPLPKTKALIGKVEIVATFLLATEVDPEHVGAYTRSGVRILFRPHAERFRAYKNGKQSEHPTTEEFFSTENMYAAPEYELQDQGQKWEPCLHASRSKQARCLLRPCFDIDYQHREGPHKANLPKSVSYALIVSVRAPRVPDLYDQVVRDYANILVPIRPRIRIPVRT